MKPAKDTLAALLNDERRSYESIGREYGVSGNAVRKWVKTYQLVVAPRRRFPNGNKSWTKKHKVCTFCDGDITGTGKMFCSIVCFRAVQRRDYWERLSQGSESGWLKCGVISTYIRTHMFIMHNSKCCLCGWGQVNEFTNKVPLEVHHVDGNWKNNLPSNLQLLCPNCHSLTATYRARNQSSLNPTAQARDKQRGRSTDRV